MKYFDTVKFQTLDTSPRVYLNALLNGEVIQLGDYMYYLAKTEENNCQLIMLKDIDSEIIESNMSLSQFITMCIKHKHKGI